MMIKRYLSRVFQIIALYPTRAIKVAIAITFLLSVTSGWNAWVSYRDFNRIFTEEFRLQNLSDQIIYLDEVLTMSARLNAATGDTQSEKRYRNFEPKLDAVIKEVITLAPEIYESQGAKQTDEANIKLVEMEYKSFDLVRQGRKEDALNLLSSNAYNTQKQIYAQGNQISTMAIQNQIQLRLAAYQQDFLGMVIIALIRLFGLVPLWIVILQIVSKNLRDRKVIQENLERSEERARATLLALPDLVFRVNREGKYLDFLTSHQGKSLVDPYQVIGNSIYESLPATIVPPHAETKYSALQKALATQTVQTYEQQVWIESKLRYEEVRVAPCGNDEAVFFVRDISDRKQAEKSLLESQQFIQTVIDTVPLPVFWKDRNSIYLGCNQQYTKILGSRSSKEIIGKTSFDFSATESEAIAFRNDDLRVMESGEAKLRIEETLTLANGEQRWLETHKAPLRDWSGNVIGVVGMFQDITDRKQAELRLQQQAEQERLLGEITKRMRSSLNLSKILNTTVEDVLQILKSDRMLVCQLSSDWTGSIIAEAALPNYQKTLDIYLPESVITQESYDHYLQGGIFVFDDREDKNQLVSPRTIEFLAESQIRALLSVPIIHNKTLWGLLVAHQCDSSRQWQDWEINLLKQTANQLAIAIKQASLFNQLQAELAERQRAEAQLTETNVQLAIFNEELGRATRLKDEFLANMSHELRTPLNAILGMTEGLKEEVFGSVNERQIKALQTIERSSNHLLELINDILDIAKIESGQIELDCTLCAVAPLCQSSLAFIKQQALQKRIQLEVKLQLNLPDLLVDERRIRQVLINLLNNAVKFTPEGGSITLEVSKLAADLATNDAPVQNFLRIAVIDTGIGISPENIQKLFQPFIQIDSALNRQYQGTGLGLALVKRIVELHAGHVGLTSKVGVGSCFTIDLPCTSDAPSLPNMTVNDQSATTLEQEDVSKVHLILLVDDNEANLSTVSSYLEVKGYRLLLAKNGQEAIALAKAYHPDLILMDIQMPIMDGIEATKQIRCDPDLVNIPIIALTALAMTGDRDRCLAAGANEYLSKPVKLKALAETIHKMI